MMGEKVYKILVKDCTNEYILGRISGMIRALGDPNSKNEYEFALKGFPYSPNFRVLRVKTTYWRYRKIRKALEKHYPGMCVFI